MVSKSGSMLHMVLGQLKLPVALSATKLRWKSGCCVLRHAYPKPTNYLLRATVNLGFDPPEMYFVHNVVEIKNKETGLLFRFHAEDALKHVLAHDERPVKVAAAKQWRQSKSYVQAAESLAILSTYILQGS